MNWILRRLREPSTWRGLVWLATVAGLSLRPDQAEAIVTAGMALTGLLGVFLADEPKNVRIELPPVELIGQPQGYNDASQVAPQVPVVHRPDDMVERDDPVAGGLRHPMQADYRPRRVEPDPNTYSQFGSGFGDRD